MNKHLNAQKICMYGVLAAITFVVKVAMSPLPNIEPTTLLLSLYTICLGYESIYIMSAYVLLEILMYGFSIWSIGYLYIWLVLIIITKLIWDISNHRLWAVIIWNGVYGFIFGALYMPLSLLTTNLTTAIGWWISGISYDAIHGVANLILSWLLMPILYKTYIKTKGNK